MRDEALPIANETVQHALYGSGHRTAWRGAAIALLLR